MSLYAVSFSAALNYFVLNIVYWVNYVSHFSRKYCNFIVMLCNSILKTISTKI